MRELKFEACCKVNSQTDKFSIYISLSSRHLGSTIYLTRIIFITALREVIENFTLICRHRFEDCSVGHNASHNFLLATIELIHHIIERDFSIISTMLMTCQPLYPMEQHWRIP